MEGTIGLQGEIAAASAVIQPTGVSKLKVHVASCTGGQECIENLLSEENYLGCFDIKIT